MSLESSETKAETPGTRTLTHPVTRLGWIPIVEFGALLALMFAFAGDPTPMVNEAHYLVKAKHFWDPSWCDADLFAASGKAHATYYLTLGWLTRFASLTTTAWVGRIIGWALLSLGLMKLCRALTFPPFLSLIVLVIWAAGIQHGNLAGEWVFGGTEAKVPAYGLLLVGVAEMVRRRWSVAWMWMGGASAFHVLVGGWSVLAGMLVFGWTEIGRRRGLHEQPPEELGSESLRKRFFTPGLFVGGALALLGLVPALWLTSGVAPDQSIASAKTYVFFRISHHLLPSTFPWHWFLRHGVLVVMAVTAACCVVRSFGRIHDTGHERPAPVFLVDSWRRFLVFVLGAVLIAVIGLAIGFMPGLDPDWVARLLRYYWFRSTDVMVPLLLAMSVAEIIRRSWNANASAGSAARWWRLASVGCAAVASMLFVWSSIERMWLAVPPSTSNRLLGFDSGATAAEQRKVHDDWIRVCDFIRFCTPEDEVFLTPRHQQTFKWYAQRAEVVNFKDVPQDAASLLEWSRRFQDVFPQRLGTMRVTIQYSKLREYR
ncbi:MAG: DUF6798 domain-containing protein, partial [Planctomycetota bacterium]